MSMVMHRTFEGAAYKQGRFSPAQRELAEETAVAISCNGSSHAVLMATPADLDDLVIGFSLAERLVSSVDEIEDINRLDCERGIDMQVRFVSDVAGKLAERRRSMVGPVGCGLCGIESLDMAMRDIEPVSAELCLSPEQIANAVHMLTKQQVLNFKTRSVHAAGWYHPTRGLVAAREDVGRHNALDKLIGALAKRGEHIASGAIVMTSRLSIELVQKAAVAGCGMIISISAPTAIAVELADKANITLATVVRDEDFELLTHPQRVAGGGEHHVA
ncbi:FdhD protein [Pseudovibrio sp. Tun.PSC04-5.I4]|nr:FdhD protein [Pseudovibrio sp. Tun.PSC04-5.I4]